VKLTAHHLVPGSKNAWSYNSTPQYAFIVCGAQLNKSTGKALISPLDGGVICLLLNVQGCNSVKKSELQTAEPLISEPNSVQVEITIQNLKFINCLVFFKFQ